MAGWCPIARVMNEMGNRYMGDIKKRRIPATKGRNKTREGNGVVEGDCRPSARAL